MIPWDIFEFICVINLPERSDRLMQFKEERDRVGIENITIIPGIKADNPTNGFNQAQHNALEMASKYESALILEDDVIFKDPEHLPNAIFELPSDWDLYYLGANVIGTNLCSWPEPVLYSPHLKRVTQAWTTHAIAYSHKGMKTILADWDYKNGQIYDDYLRCNLEKLQAYIVYPMVADQRPGFSDIWNCPTNYGFFNKWSQ